jgi:hypothetical protein
VGHLGGGLDQYLTVTQAMDNGHSENAVILLCPVVTEFAAAVRCCVIGEQFDLCGNLETDCTA